MPEDGFLEPDAEDRDEHLMAIVRREVNERLKQREAQRAESARTTRLIMAAVHLYPYVTAVFPDPAEQGLQSAFKVGGEVTENDVARSLRCVEIAFGMERTIRARIEREAGL